ncbi:MAG: hypothetical protein WBN40_14225 [Pseudomonadales bacterium]
MKERSLAQRTKRWLLRALALLLLVNLLFLALRASLGPVDGWLKRAAPDDQRVEPVTSDTATLELLEPITASREDTAGAIRIDYPDGARCTFLSIDVSPPYQSGVDAGPDFDAVTAVSAGDAGPAVGAALEHAVASRAQLLSLQQRLVAVGLDAQAVHVNTEELQKHVVYIEGVAESELYSNMRRAHASHHDAFIVNLQGGRRVVALGFYNNESDAAAARQGFSGQGMSLAVGIYSETVQRLFLLLDPAASANLSARLWAELREDFQQLQRVEKYCDSVARPAQLE